MSGQLGLQGIEVVLRQYGPSESNLIFKKTGFYQFSQV
jgi:hypothetical protein